MLEDDAILAVSTLLARYPHAVDVGTPEEVGSLFGEHGRLIAHGGRVCTGEAGVAAFLTESRASRSNSPGGSRLRHHVSSESINVDGQRATAVSYFMAIGNNGPDHWGVYEDKLACIDDSWLFEERVITIEGADPAGWVGSGAAPVRLAR